MNKARKEARRVEKTGRGRRRGVKNEDKINGKNKLSVLRGEKSLTTSGEIHRVSDGIVSVDAESHEDVGRRIDDNSLQESNQFAA